MDSCITYLDVKSTESTIQSGEGGVGVGVDCRAKCDVRCKFGASEIDSNKVEDNEVKKNS